MSLFQADSRALQRPFRHRLAADGPARTYEWLVELLEAQAPRLRGQNVLYVALTGDSRGLDWIAEHAASPVDPSWGVAAAMLHPTWERVHGWLRTNGSLQLVGLDALLACRAPCASMSPVHQRCAPTLAEPGSAEDVRLCLAEVLAERNTPRVREAVGAIDRELDVILRAEAPRLWPADLPAQA